MHNLKKIIAIFVVIMVVSSTVVGAAELEAKESTHTSFFDHPLVISFLEFFGISNTEKEEKDEPVVAKKKVEIVDEPKEKKEAEKIEEKKPKYGVDFSEIRERYPNKKFVKYVLTDEVEEHLNKVEAETGIPGAVIIAQAICEVGWDLSTPKGRGIDSYNLFNIKNCDGNYVYWGGCKYQCYDSYIDAIDAYVELITTLPRYSKAYQNLQKGGDFFTYFWQIGEAGYYEASKKTYSNNCVSIINSNDLVAKQPLA